MDAYQRLKQLIAEIEDDIQKAAGGNKAAGTRVRQAMQQVKEAAQEVRKAVLEMRAPGTPGESAAPGQPKGKPA